MDEIVRGVDVEGTEKHLVVRGGRDEPKYPDEQEHDTEKNRGDFNHFLISC